MKRLAALLPQKLFTATMRKVLEKSIATVRSAYPELTPLFEQRREEEGYRSLGQYFFWLGFYDLILRKPHHVTAEVAHQSPHYQERAVQIVLENFESGPKPGGFFESRLREAATEETWRLHAMVRQRDEVIREKDARISELEQELARERAQLKL